MKTKEKRRKQNVEGASREKLSLYPLSIEDALRAAARTGRPPDVTPKPKRKRKKRID